MLSSRSDSVIHDMAHSSESGIAGPRTSGHALGVPLSIQITPVSSTIESMFESHAPRDQSLRNRARSGEASGLFLERNVDENSLQAARRLSGSQARLTRMSFSRSAGSREDNRPIQELVEVDASGASSKERGFGSPPRSASFHGSSETKRKPQGQSSSSVTETSIIPRGPMKEPHGSSSNKQKNDALAAAFAERTSSPLANSGSKGALTSAFRNTKFESAKLSGSLLDKGRIAPTGLDATSLYESVIQRQEHGTVTTSHEGFKAPRLSSSGPDARTTTESTKVGNQLRTGTATAIQEVVPQDVAVVEVRTMTQSSSERQNPQLSLTTKKTSAHGPGWSQQTVSSKLKMHEIVGRTTSKTKPDNLPITGIKSGSQTFSVKQDLGNRELLTDSTARTFAGPTEKDSIATPSLLQKGTPSKTQHSAHGSNVVDNAADALHNSATASLLYPTSLEKAASSHSMNQQSLFQSNLSLGNNFDTSVLTAAKAETSAPFSLTSSSVSEKTSKSLIQLSTHPTSIPSNNITFTSAATHASDKASGVVTNQDVSQHTLLDRPALTFLGSSDESRFLTSSPPRKTSSRTFTLEPVTQTVSLDRPTGSIEATSMNSTTSAFANQAEHLQDISDKPTGPATQDLHESAGPFLRGSRGETTSSHPDSCEPTRVVTSAPERTSSKSIIEESVRQTDFSAAASEALVSAHAKDETSSSSVRDLVKQTPIQTGSNNYSLSAGTQLTMTKKVNTRWSVSEPVQHSFFERVEGSKYQTFDNTRRSQVPSSGVVSDFQAFEVTTGREPTQAVAEIPCEPESQSQASRDLNAEYISAHKEKEIEQKAGSSTATALTPLPELSLNGSTPKASSEEIRSSETERSASKAIDRDDALQWPLINAGVRSTRLGEAAALFEASSDGTQADHRRIQMEFSDDRDIIEMEKHEDREARYENSSESRICEVAMEKGPAPAIVSELPAESQIAPIKYGAEPEEEVIGEVKEQPRMDSSLMQYTPDDYILAQIVREVEKKIEASSRYHYEPLPDDVLTIRSSKGIESLGLLRYETYEEELLLRHSEDDLTREQEKPTAEASEQSATAIEEPVAALDQEGYAGVLEEFYESAEKLAPEPEPEGPVDAGVPPSGDIHEEAKMKIEDYSYAVATETEKKSNVIAEEQERQKCEHAENKEAEDKEPFPKKSFDDIREERRRQFEQRWMDRPVVTEREATTATVKSREALETAHGAPLTTAQAESAETRDKVFASKQEGEHSSENAVRRFIAAAIEEAAKREEAAKSVKRFREYPCSVSVEDASRKTCSDSSDTSASDLASRKEEERRLADMKVQQKKDKTMPQLVRCRSIAELIEQIIQQHVSRTDVRKDGHACEKQELAQDFISAQAPVFPTSMVQQEIPVYYQTETTTQKRGEQYVADPRYSLLGVSRKSDTHLEANSHSERRFSFSTLGGRGAKCVIRKLEPGALTYIVEVAPADKNQENQTDMVMAEEQMLVSEIFDQITTPTLRVSSSGSRLNETAAITLSPSASLTAIRNAYAQAVARRVLGKQSPQGNEGVLSASQRAKFYENKQGLYDQKSASSTSVRSAPSVEDYIVQRMVEGGVIRNHRELWGREPLKFENIIVSRAGSMGSMAKTNASSEAISGPAPTPHDVEPADAEVKGAENCADAAGQTPKEEAPPKVEAPPEATFKAVRDEAAAATNFAGEKQVVAAGSVDSHERGHVSAFASSEATTAESERTAAVTATAPTDQQRSEMKQASAEAFTCKVSTASSECVNCRNRIAPEKSFESFICFGLHELPKFFAPVPFDVSEAIKLRIATDEDVREIMSLPWREPESVYTLHAAIVTRHLLCPSSFFVAVDTSRDVICGTASVLLFDEEVAFCGFFRILDKYPFEHVGTLLWNELLHVTSGKNLFTVLPEPAYQELQKIYPFPSNPATGILFGPVRMSRAAFSRTVLVLEYKDKYFDALASAGCLVLRWLFADDPETAQSLLSSLLASCSHEDEVDVAAAFFLRSISTRPILDKISTRQLKPWRLVYTKREPLHSYGRVVCLTTV
ncbi:hypothetical protein HPB50_006384 [Hyalomma asiaticum]|uniref:Uncharacterized protein n=1 Tax=Hyalomma asiaticum TaxID=266040 RepID=A0ACB7STT0_HYAAI|nr:hypothetical protein HPB50_006384 [Hyalomma asiaticum]